MVNEIKELKYIWKSMKYDALKYVKDCPEWIKSKGGLTIKSLPKIIEIKGPRERYIADSWKLPKNILEQTGYIYILDIMDYFSKFIMSYPLGKKMQ